jgi:hypothetical protein
MDGGGLRQPENGVGLVWGRADFILWGGRGQRAGAFQAAFGGG